MLASEARLRKSTDITDVLRNGIRLPSRLLVLHVLLNVGTTSKVAFAVGKSVGNSAERHQVTRRLRHIMRMELDRVPTGSHIVVRAFPDAKHATFAQLHENVSYALTKLSGKP